MWFVAERIWFVAGRIWSVAGRIWCFVRGRGGVATGRRERIFIELFLSGT